MDSVRNARRLAGRARGRRRLLVAVAVTLGLLSAPSAVGGTHRAVTVRPSVCADVCAVSLEVSGDARALGKAQTTRLEPGEREIVTGDGSIRRVADLSPGTDVRIAGGGLARVTAVSPGPARPKSAASGAHRVTAISARETTVLAIVLTLTAPLSTTPEHRFFELSRGWTKAEDLRPGDAIATRSGAPQTVTAATELRRVAPTTVYNLEVDEARTYFVGSDGLLVHNGTCVPQLEGAHAGRRTTHAAEVVAPPFLSRDVVVGAQIGASTGSNTGGLYRGSDGVVRYVKEYTVPAQAYGEHVANQIYRDMGFDAPKSALFQDGNKVGYASEFIPNTKEVDVEAVTQAQAKMFVEGMVVDRLIDNQDLHPANVLVHDGKILRIDNGGAFTFTGVGGLRKSSDFSGPFSHWALATQMGYAAGLTQAEAAKVLQGSAKKIDRLLERDGSWAKYVERNSPGLSAEEQSKIAAILEKNTKAIKGGEGYDALMEDLAPPAD